MKLAIVKLEEIYEEERVRKEYGNLQELVHSIKKEGLIQPLACTECSGPIGEIRYRLLAGGRRLRAAREAGQEEVPIRIYDEQLSELQIKSIELAENIYRKDLEYAEEVKLCKEINDLQIAIYGEKVSTTPGASGWSQRDTATLLGRSPASVTADIQLAEAIAKFPEIGKLKDKAEARKALTMLYESISRDELSTRLMATKAETTTDFKKEGLINAFIVKDFFEGVKDIPDGWVDLIEIDPPYAINLTETKKHRALSELQMEGYNEIDYKSYLPFMDKVFSECRRVLKDDGWMIVWFAADPWFEHIYTLLKNNQFNLNKLPGLWVKKSEEKAAQAQSMQPTLYLANAYEMFFYCRKGGATVYKPGKQNVFIHQQVSSSKKIHQTERPIELLMELLSIFVAPDSRVLVPFLGSGNTMLAAVNLDMKPFGYELTDAYKSSFVIKVHEGEYGKYTSYGG